MYVVSWRPNPDKSPFWNYNMIPKYTHATVHKSQICITSCMCSSDRCQLRTCLDHWHTEMRQNVSIDVRLCHVLFCCGCRMTSGCTAPRRGDTCICSRRFSSSPRGKKMATYWSKSQYRCAIILMRLVKHVKTTNCLADCAVRCMSTRTCTCTCFNILTACFHSAQT